MTAGVTHVKTNTLWYGILLMLCAVLPGWVATFTFHIICMTFLTWVQQEACRNTSRQPYLQARQEIWGGVRSTRSSFNTLNKWLAPRSSPSRPNGWPALWSSPNRLPGFQNDIVTLPSGFGDIVSGVFSQQWCNRSRVVSSQKDVIILSAESLMSLLGYISLPEPLSMHKFPAIPEFMSILTLVFLPKSIPILISLCCPSATPSSLLPTPGRLMIFENTVVVHGQGLMIQLNSVKTFTTSVNLQFSLTSSF